MIMIKAKNSKAKTFKNDMPILSASTSIILAAWALK